MRRWSGFQIAATTLGAAAVLAAAPVIPDPVLVEGPVELPDRLTLAPSTQYARVGSDGARIGHTVEQGLPGEVELTLAVVAVTAADDGSPRLGGPAEGVRLPSDRVVLAQGERAVLTSAAAPGTSGVVAVTATSPGAEPLVAYVALGPDTGGDVAVATELGTDAATVALTSATATVAEVRLTVTGPLGWDIVDDSLGPLVLLPGATRELDWQLALPSVPFPLTLRTEVGTPDGEVRTEEATVWVGAGRLLAGALVLVGVSAGAAVTVALRRRGRTPAA